MFSQSLLRRFHHLVRELDARGFVGDFRKLQGVNLPSTRKQALAAITSKQNVVFCGHYHTGKLTLLKAVGAHCEERLGLKVAYVSADNRRANRLDGYLIHHFLGLRMSADDLPSQEQLEGTLERHVRLVDSTYGGHLPSLQNTDVLVLDSIEKVPPVVLLSMDAVGRRQRGRPHEPFGGLRIFAAADFWRLPVHPTSDMGGYPFQLEQWRELFPKQIALEETHGQDAVLNAFTVKALYGNLAASDIKDLEQLSLAGKPEAAIFAREALDDDDEFVREDDEEEEGVESKEEGEEENEKAHYSLSTTPPLTANTSKTTVMLNDNMTSNADALIRFTVRFPKQPALKVMPVKYRQLKRTEIGNFLVNMLVQSFLPASLGLVDSLSVEVGAKVHLLLDGTATYGVPGGAVGEVMSVKEHFITVYFPAEYRTVDIPRLRATIYHPLYPEVKYEVRQFPLYPRQHLCPNTILSYPNCFHVHINSRRLADTNDLGNLLAHMRSFRDFTLRNTADFAHLDGVVHEPTRIFLSELLRRPLTTAAETWCRNCKSFIPSDRFFAHWHDCVKTVRWCSECSKTVPLELLEPHREKHQVVLCMDCGQAVEWRYWEAHRLSCPAMMREISPDNVFLPLRTRQLALELGLDKRDLHTMKNFSRSMLPKPAKAAS